jgi:hypothetical protein
MRLSLACVRRPVRQRLEPRQQQRGTIMEKEFYLAGGAGHEEARAVEVSAVQVGQRGVRPAAQLAAHRRRQAAPLTAWPCITCVSFGFTVLDGSVRYCPLADGPAWATMLLPDQGRWVQLCRSQVQGGKSRQHSQTQPELPGKPLLDHCNRAPASVPSCAAGTARRSSNTNSEPFQASPPSCRR